MIDTKHFDEMDMLLYAAVKHAGKNEIEEYNSTDTSVKLSDNAEKRIVKLLHKEDRRIEREQKYIERHTTYYPVREILKRVAVVVLVVMSVGFAGALSIEAVRVEIRNAVVAWFEEYLDIDFKIDEIEQVTDVILEYKEPQLGEEYVRYEIMKSEYKYYIEYENDSALISYTQTPRNLYNLFKTNEDTIIYDVIVQGKPGVFAKNEIDGIVLTTVTWYDEAYAYVLSSNLSEKDLLAIAEDIQ